jgi:hypothetical protein
MQQHQRWGAKNQPYLKALGRQHNCCHLGLFPYLRSGAAQVPECCSLCRVRGLL